MSFPALGARAVTIGSANDAIPISASTTLNVFGNGYTSTGGGDARACDAILASATTTFSGITSKGNLRTGLVIPAGTTGLKLIQVTAITGGGGSLWALVG